MSLRNIPAVDEILIQEKVTKYINVYKREFIVDILRETISVIRQKLKSVKKEISSEEIMEYILTDLEFRIIDLTRGSLIRVINGTGVVLHTNLGRAPLSERALDYVNRTADNYINLEYDLEKGERGSRYNHVEKLLTYLTGAEAALVVNNNAAAVLLGLNTLANNKEVIVSRGQLVEIGGAFRIPEVMKLSGATLVEVGTTNRTYVLDYYQAINDQTGLLFAAHTSNYKIIGFSHETRLEDIVNLGRKQEIPVMQDLGSGILYPLEDWGLREEPTVQKCIDCGTDIVTFSGDKLLGGPQAGIIVGKKRYIELMKKNQLTRALRVDKLTIAALEGTLLDYLTQNPAQ